MAKNFNVSFDIHGRLDPSALNALQNAANGLQNLRNVAKAVNAQAIKNAQALSVAQDVLKNIQGYRALQREIQATEKKRAQELLTASRMVGQWKKVHGEVDKLQGSLAQLRKQRQTADKNLAEERGALNYLRQQRRELKEQIKALGATRGRKIPRELLGTAQGKALAQALRQLDANKRNIEECRTAFRLAAEQVARLRTQVASVGSELKTAKRSASALDGVFNKSTQEVRRLGEQLARQRSDLTQLSGSLQSRGVSGTLAAHEMKLRAEIQATTNALNHEIAALERRNQLQNNFRQASQNLSISYENFQGALQTAQTVMTPFADATQNAMDFEYAMSKVKALTQMRNIRSGNMERVRQEMADLTAQAESLGATTEFTRGEIAAGMGFYGMAGWDKTRIEAAMPMTVDLSTITGQHNIPRMSDIISDTSTALGIKAGDTVTLGNGKIVDAISHYGDAWAYAITQANLNSEDLTTALKYNGPAMHLAGLSLGEIFASNMVSANAGLKGSIAGTAFRSGIIRIQAPAKAGAKALEEMGLGASEAQKEMAAAGDAMNRYGVTANSVMGKLVQIKQHFDALGAAGDKEGQTSLVNDIFGKYGYSTWAHILSASNLDDLFKIATEIDSGQIEGWAADTANVMRDNAKTSIDLLTSALDALQGAIGDALTPTVRSAAEAFTPMVAQAAEWGKQNQTAVQWCALLASALSTAAVACAGLALAGAAFGYIVSGAQMAFNALLFLGRGIWMAIAAFRAASIVTAAWGAITAAAGFVASAPIWGIVAAVLAVIGVIGYATGAFDGLGDALSAAWNDPRGAVLGFRDLVQSSVDSAVRYVMDRWNTLRSALSHPLDAVINFIDHGSVVGGNVKSGEQQRVERPAPPTPAPAPQIIQQAAQPTLTLPPYLQSQAAPAPETPQLDTSATQAALDAVGTSASTAATNMEGVNTAAQSVTQAGEAFANLPAAVEPTAAAFSNLPAALQPAQDSAAQTATALTATGTSAQNLSTAMQGDTTSTQAHTAGVGANTAALQANIGALQAFGAACQGAVGGVTALGSAASSAAGSVSGLGSAAQSACAELAAAGANAASAVNSAVASMPRGGTAETNYEGGIYKRGAFLTTFAERSPEAAIPLDNSRRAKDLWTQAGEMLGILPQTQPIDFDRFPTTTPPFNPEPEKTLPQGERVPTRARRRPPQRQRRRPQVPRVSRIPEWAMQSTPPYNPNMPRVRRPQFTPGGQILNEVIRGFGGGKIVDVIEGIFGGFGGAPRPTPAMGQRPQFTPGGQILNEVIRGFGGGKIVDAVERIFGGFGGDMPNRILTPQMPAPSMDQGGLIGRLVDRFTGAPQSEPQPPMINLTVHVTINGNADEATVQRGVEAALPAVDDWARRLSEHRHEQRRRAYT